MKFVCCHIVGLIFTVLYSIHKVRKPPLYPLTQEAIDLMHVGNFEKKIRFIQPACYTSIVKKTNFDQEYCTIICNTELQEIFLLFSRFLNYRRLIIKSGYKFFKETFFKWLEKQLQYILSRFCFSIIYKIKWLSLFNSSVKYLQHEQFHQPASKNTFIY